MPVQKPLLGQRAVATAWKTLTSEVINLLGMWTHLHLASSHYAAHPEPGAGAVRWLGAVVHILNSILAWTLLKGFGPLV